PGGTADGLNQYAYCHGNPIILRDTNGFRDTVYQMGPEFEKDIHTNTPQSKARLEEALTNRIVSENGILYRIDRPLVEWRGDKIGWYFNAKQSGITRLGPEEGAGTTAESKTGGPSTNETPSKDPPPPDTPPNQSPSTPSQSSEGERAGGGGDKSEGRRFFTSS